MAEVIQMPRMSDTMEEGVIVEWHKKVGDAIVPGDLLAEVETDKATMELESYQEGTILYIGVDKGDAVPVEGVLAIIGEKDEDYKTLLAEVVSKNNDSGKEEKSDKKSSEKQVENAEPAKAAPAAQKSTTTQTQKSVDVKEPTPSSNGRIKISPLAKKLALENGIPITAIAGSGDEGRIIKKDIEAYLTNGGSKNAAAGSAQVNVQLPTIVAEESYEEISVSQMRKTIAARLGESKFGAPHFYLTIDILMDNLMAARKNMNEQSPVKISFNDLVIKAAAVALRSHPYVNASWLGDKIRLNKHIHIGMAVAVDEGLLVPVIRFADNKTLSHIAAETRELGNKAKSKKLGLDEMQGNTFTISNLGMMGIEEFTAIINPPDACIMAVGGIRKQPTLDDSGNLKVENRMKVTLSCDHRVVDGATGAKFLQNFKANLENPVNMLI